MGKSWNSRFLGNCPLPYLVDEMGYSIVKQANMAERKGDTIRKQPAIGILLAPTGYADGSHVRSRQRWKGKPTVNIHGESG